MQRDVSTPPGEPRRTKNPAAQPLRPGQATWLAGPRAPEASAPPAGETSSATAPGRAGPRQARAGEGQSFSAASPRHGRRGLRRTAGAGWMSSAADETQSARSLGASGQAERQPEGPVEAGAVTGGRARGACGSSARPRVGRQASIPDGVGESLLLGPRCTPGGRAATRMAMEESIVSGCARPELATAERAEGGKPSARPTVTQRWPVGSVLQGQLTAEPGRRPRGVGGNPVKSGPNSHIPRVPGTHDQGPALLPRDVLRLVIPCVPSSAIENLGASLLQLPQADRLPA
jgi:hypothetical protein